jgi:hypothetical protein
MNLKKNKKWTKKIWVNTANSQKSRSELWDNDNSIERKSKQIIKALYLVNPIFKDESEK